jgi:hypothetical protein
VLQCVCVCVCVCLGFTTFAHIYAYILYTRYALAPVSRKGECFFSTLIFVPSQTTEFFFSSRDFSIKKSNRLSHKRGLPAASSAQSTSQIHENF